MNLTRPKAPRELVSSSEIFITWGEKNDVPIQMAKIIENSPTATSNVDVIQRFFIGGGLSGNLGDFKMNKEQTLFDFHKQVAETYGMFEGAACKAKYEPETFRVQEWTSLQFTGARLGLQNEEGDISKIVYNPFMGMANYKKQDNRHYDIFNPDAEWVKKRMALIKKDDEVNKFRGQIMYFASTSVTSPFYPKPKYWSASNAMECDYLIWLFHKKNINNNFFLGLIIRMLGDPNKPSEHPDDLLNEDEQAKTGRKYSKTVAERFELELQEQFAGAEQGGVAMILWSAIKDSLPQIDPFPTSTNEELFATLSKLVTEVISRSTKVPPMLANIEQQGSLSDASKIREATELMNKMSEPGRITLEQKYKKMLMAMKERPSDAEIKNLKILPFQFFKNEVPDDKIWESMDVKEHRNWIRQNTTVEIADADPAQLPAAPPRITFNTIANGKAH